MRAAGNSKTWLPCELGFESLTVHLNDLVCLVTVSLVCNDWMYNCIECLSFGYSMIDCSLVAVNSLRIGWLHN